jgi:hypothetical protein
MATTTNFGFNTPNDTGLVKDGALSIRTLGNNVDARFGDVTNYPNQIVNVVSGVSRPVPYATSSNTATIAYAASTSATVAVTLPASRFTQAPQVALSPTTNSTLAGLTVTSVTGITTSGFTARGYYAPATNQTGNVLLAWIAIQMTSAAAGG